MEFTRYWGQAEGAALPKIKETRAPAGAGNAGHRKKNTFIIRQNADSVKERIATPVCGLVRNDREWPEIGDVAFWPCCRDVICGTVVGEMMDFSTGERLLAVRSFGGVSWFRPDRLCRTREEAQKRIDDSFLRVGVTGKAAET